MRRYAALILLIGLAMTAVGCAGGGGASWFFFMAVLLSANLTLMACGTDDGDGSATNSSDTSEADTAQGDVTSDSTLSDVSVGGDAQPDAQECDGTWEQTCNEDGQVEKVCCPEGMVCNYGMGLIICDDGSCTYDGAPGTDPCAEDKDVTEPDVWDKDVTDKDAWDKDVTDKDAWDKDVSDKDAADCDGTWEQMCNADGQVEKVCCPAGVACNYGMGMSICEDGSCVNMPDTCDDEADVMEPDVVDSDVPEKDVAGPDVEECDGTWESMCNEFGEVDQACCPAGMACNYGMTMVICEDGSCVNMPDTCEEKEPACDGTWEQTCNEKGQVEEVCCPAGVACNYGMGMVICEDGSCVVEPDTCPENQ